MKRFYIFALSIIALATILFSCSAQKNNAKLLNGRWDIIEVKGEKIAAENTPFMEFDMSENRLHGNSGCNIFNTTFSLDKTNPEALQIAEGASTMMACPDMDLERKILTSMSEVRAVESGKDANEMFLTDGNGQILLKLQKK